MKIILILVLMRYGGFGAGHFDKWSGKQEETPVNLHQGIVYYRCPSTVPFSFSATKDTLPSSVSDSILYDDDVSPAGSRLYPPGRMAVRFPIPFHPFKMDAFSYFTREIANPSASHILHLYSGNGSMPDSIPVDLITPITRSGLTPGWHYENVADSNIVIDSGNLYVVFQFVDSTGPSIGDASGNFPPNWNWNSFNDAVSPFHWVSETDGIMVRLYGEYANHTDYNVQPLNIVYPTGWNYPDSQVIPKVVVRNFGNLSASGFNVVCKIDTSGQTVYQQSVNVSKTLSPLTDTTLVSFPAWTTGKEDIKYNLSFYTDWGFDTLKAYDTLKMFDTTKYFVEVEERPVNKIGAYNEGMAYDGASFYRLEVHHTGVSTYWTSIFKINPITGIVDTVLPGPCETGEGIAYGCGDLWIAGLTPRGLYRIHTNGQLVATYSLPGSFPEVLAFNDSTKHLWVYSGNSEAFYELDTLGNTLQTISTGSLVPNGVCGTFVNDSIFLMNNYNQYLVQKLKIKDSTVTEINRYSIKQYSFPGYPEAIVYDGNYVWMSGEVFDTVLHKFAIYGSTGVEENNAEYLMPDAKLEIFPTPATINAGITIKGLGINPKERITIHVYDLTGRLVRVLTPDFKSSVAYVKWDCKNNNGRMIKSGVYFCKLKTVEKEITRKIILLK